MTAFNRDFDLTEVGNSFHDVSYDSDFEEFEEERLYEPLPWNDPIELDAPSLMNLLPCDILTNELNDDTHPQSHIEYDWPKSNVPYGTLYTSTNQPYDSNNSTDMQNQYWFPYPSSSYNSYNLSDFHYPTTYSSRTYPDIFESNLTHNDLHVPMPPWSPGTSDLQKISNFKHNDMHDPTSSWHPSTPELQNMFSRKMYHFDARSPYGDYSSTIVSDSQMKSSKRQPRPKLFVAPRSGGPIYQLNPHDVLSGRGGRVNSQSGNIQFREIVAGYRAKYVDPSTRKLEKAHIAADIVHLVRSKGGRFLLEDDYYPGTWYEIGDARAIRKAGQALREDPNTTANVNRVVSQDDNDSLSSSEYAEGMLENKSKRHKAATAQESSQTSTWTATRT